MSDVVLRVEGLSKHYGGVAALSGVDLEVADGEVHGVIGPNGAGKSTLVDVITGFASPSAGRVWHRDADLTDKPPHRVVEAGLARTFQHTSVFDEATVAKNLWIAAQASAKARRRRAAWGRRGDRQQGATDRRMAEVLDVTGLHADAQRLSASLPYGAQRRLEVAVALMTDAPVLLLDEPAAGMNVVESAEFVELVRTIAAGRTVLLIEHDMSVIRALCSRLTVLLDGRVIAQGDAAQVLADPRVADVYLGRLADE